MTPVTMGSHSQDRKEVEEEASLATASSLHQDWDFRQGEKDSCVYLDRGPGLVLMRVYIRGRPEDSSAQVH